jgi:ABC-2 type transport system permease protein
MTAGEQAIALKTIVHKEIRRILRIWIQTLLPSAITTTLYFLIFGKFIGSQVRDIGGFSYMQFIVPGIIMMSVITNSFTNVVSSFFGTKFQKSIEEILVSPTPNYIIIIGYCMGGIARGLFVGFVVLLVSLIFSPLKVHNVFVVIVFMLLTSIVFSLGGLLNSIFAKKFDDVSIFPTFVLTPLTYLGGVFYSIDMLPEFWRKMSLFNPILYMINGFRFGFAAVLFWTNEYLIRRGVGLKA